MARYTQQARKQKRVTVAPETVATEVRSFEGNINFKGTALRQLELILASSIFGEPSFYEGDTRATLTERAIDRALDEDFGGTLALATKLRNHYWMRHNPQVVLMRAAMHPKRAEFTAANPGAFYEYADSVIRRPDEVTFQLEYFASKATDSARKFAKLPGIAKRYLSQRLSKFNAYQIKKYANTGIGLVDATRIVHASSDSLSALLRGELQVEEGEKTWKVLRSEGMTWAKILRSEIRLSHMDFLFNLRGMLQDIEKDTDLKANEKDMFAREVCSRLIAGVKGSIVFPYRYWTAYDTIRKETSMQYRQYALDALETCLDNAIAEMPRIPGRVAVLADNSPNMRQLPGVEGTTHRFVDLANISAVMTAKQAEYGLLVPFATSFAHVQVSARKGTIEQADNLATVAQRLGGGTEMAPFFQQAIAAKEHYDFVFIYSDCQTQPKHGVTSYYNTQSREVQQMWEVVEQYRKRVNKKVRVFVVQCAGYDNSIQPDVVQYGANLTGWTGKETAYAMELDRLWRESE